ncbi:MAG: methyltransferase domain-containing protein [Chitinophagaceae bacterium]|nr:methyltransferase domain-containing protein [Chitinophagaceae bacterium]
MLFRQRSYQKEILDQRGIPFNDIKQVMKELDVVNQWLGGHNTTLKGIKHLVQKSRKKIELLRVTEIGCGGGDNLRVIKNWAEKNSIAIELTGIDINPECVEFATKHPDNKGIHFICSDYKAVSFEILPHVIFSSLFCHHFTDQELVEMLKWLQQNSTIGFFINDLHRHPFAYYSIMALTKIFSKSYLVKNDGPLSVKRAFVKHDWAALFVKAGISNYECTWQWAFRWLVTCSNNATAK